MQAADISSTAPPIPGLLIGSSWKLRATLVMLLVVFAYATAVTFANKHKRKRVAAALCRGAVEDETICVVVVIADVDAKSTLNALLNSARCPNRLSICVVSNIPQPTATEHPNVRLAVTNTSDFAARTMRHHRYAIRHMYAKERFIMFAPLHGTYCEDWDAVLVESLRALPESSCLTQRVSMRGKKPSFLAYADGGLLVPVVRSVPFGSSTGGCTELVCWTADFSFSTAAALLVSGVYGDATTFDADIGGEDSYISSQLWTSGVRFFTPPQSVVHRSEPPVNPYRHVASLLTRRLWHATSGCLHVCNRLTVSLPGCA